jgi:protein-S-isoprenylcysteine O-methyltransferase Ste14
MSIRPQTFFASKDIRPLRRALLFGVTVIGMGIAAVAASAWPTDTLVRPAIKAIGIALIVVCIVGRSWSRLYVGWYKTRRLVRAGPYSICRNPLYSFSILGSAGAAVQSGSIGAALIVAIAVWYVLYLVTLREEETLAALHGKNYQAYMRDVPQFLPRLSLWQDVEMVEARPLDTVKTFLEGCLFLLASPAFALIEYSQNNGMLPVLFRIF